MSLGVLGPTRLLKGAGALLVLLALAPISASAATRVFGYTGGEQTYLVGPDVHSLHVVAIGAPGGDGSDDPPNQFGGLGGFGARLEGDLAVTPGQMLFVEVGGIGADGGGVAGGGKGGFNGGGSSDDGGFLLPGGGGGGASDVRSCSIAAVCPGVDTLASRLLVAAGGGGGGTIGRIESPNGGEGGDADEAGATGQALNCSTGATPGAGGGAGTQVAGGAGGAGGMNGAPAGLPGTLGQGGDAGSGGSNSEPGGGGGGGYYGGGAGGSGNGCAGGGGGGGSSFASSAITDLVLSTDRTGVPSVTITPITPAVASASPPQQPVAAKPSNVIKFERLRKFRRRGTALLTLELPGPGSLRFSGNGLLPPRGFGPTDTKALAARGAVSLLIQVKGKRKLKLDRTGRVKVKAAVTFIPTGGDPNTFERSITLIKTVH